MARRIRIAVAASALSVAVVGVCGYACSAWSASRRAAEHELVQWARTGAAQLAGLAECESDALSRWGRGKADDGELVFKRWSIAVMTDMEAFATALVDAQGVVLTSWPASVDMGDRLAISPGSRVAVVVASESVGGPNGLTAAVAPLDRGSQVLPVAYTCVFAKTEPDISGHIRPATIFTGGIVAAVAVVVLVADSYLRRRVFQPLAEIGAKVRQVRSLRGKAQSQHEDEFDRLASNVQALCDELDSALRRAASAEGSVDHMVERRTKQISRLLQRAETDAEIDALTRLANRRFVQNRLDGLVQEQLRRKANLVAIAFDVDNFKPLNDTEGHAAGDNVLKFVGELLRGCLRENDVAVRMGGDEFTVLMADISAQEGTAVAERIVQMFAQRMRASSIKTPVTLSAGVASLESLAEKTGEKLLNSADEALYASKRSGKNRIANYK